MRKHLTYANVISTLALIAVIAGGAAFALPGKNSVQANDLKKNSVKARAIAKNAVRAAEIKDGAVRAAEVADGSVGVAKLGSNSVVARIRTTGSVDTGDVDLANAKTMPVAGATWTQAPGELQIFFGEVTYTMTGPCTNGRGAVYVEIDGQLIDEQFGDNLYDDSPGTHTLPFLLYRPWLPAVASPTQHTATIRAYDYCDNAGESVTVDSVKVNVVAVR